MAPHWIEMAQHALKVIPVLVLTFGLAYLVLAWLNELFEDHGEIGFAVKLAVLISGGFVLITCVDRIDVWIAAALGVVTCTIVAYIGAQTESEHYAD